jgi:hypothetical protein
MCSRFQLVLILTVNRRPTEDDRWLDSSVDGTWPRPTGDEKLLRYDVRKEPDRLFGFEHDE